MKRYNGAHGYPDMVEANDGHWVTYESYSLALLDANKSSERYWASTCTSDDKIRAEYENQLAKQQTIITVLSAILFVLGMGAIFTFIGG